MKNITVDIVAGIISVSSSFYKKASVAGTPEYNQLMAVRAQNAGFQTVVRRFKTNKTQDRYKGLTYEFMREYLARVKDADGMKELENMINISKCHSAGFRYPVIKSWFLKRYPEIESFGAAPDEAMITDLPATGTEG